MRARFGALFVAALCGGLLIACFGAPEPEPPPPTVTPTPITVQAPVRLPTATLLPPTVTASPTATQRPVTAVVTATTAQMATIPTTTPRLPDATATAVPAASPTNSPLAASPFGPVRVYESSIAIPTYPRERYQTNAVDPVFDWPYQKFDMERFQQEAPAPAPRQYRLVVLENDFLKVMIMPELGGRIWQVVDKTTGRNVFYQNPVIKPTAWGPEAQKGWLAAGGLEWGIPVAEHGYDWGAPWGFIPMQFGPDHAAITVFTPRDGRQLYASVAVSLRADEASFTIEPTITNEGEQPLRFDFWHSAMLPASQDVRFLLPTDEVTVHSTGNPLLPAAGQRMTWPHYRGRDWSRLSTWQQYAGLFESPQAHGPAVAVYDAAADAGIARVFPKEVAVGSKIFSPGWSQPLDSALYTDDGSSYVEIHGGLAPTFAQQTFLSPNQAVSWRESWYPVHGVGTAIAAGETGALGGQRVATGVDVGLYAPHALQGSLALFAGEREIERKPLSLMPGESYRAVWPLANQLVGELRLVFDGADGTRLLTGQVE